jgi:hypothetical protein
VFEPHVLTDLIHSSEFSDENLQFDKMNNATERNPYVDKSRTRRELAQHDSPFAKGTLCEYGKQSLRDTFGSRPEPTLSS